MAVKKRRNSIHVVYEGYRERYFLEHLERHSDVRLNWKPSNGGNANQIVINGIKYSARDVSVYVLFDEDFESKPDHQISVETLEGLEKIWKLERNALTGCRYKQLQSMNKDMRNPIILVSFPQSIEGFLLRLLELPLSPRTEGSLGEGSPPETPDNSQRDKLDGKTTKQLKQMIDGILGNVQLHKDDVLQMQTYDDKISQYKEEIAKQKQSEPNYREYRRSLEAKIKEYERSKNKVTFMRFLNDKLPLPVIIAKRNDIPEIDILLQAFGL